MKNYQGLMEWVLLGVLIRSCLTDHRVKPLPIAGKRVAGTAPSQTRTRALRFRQHANTGDASEGALFI